MVSRLAIAWLAVCLALPVLAGPCQRRILYNLDGDSCMTLKAGRVGPGPIFTNDLVALMAELARPGSQVDTLLLCINAQAMYYPTRVGTRRGALSTPAEQAAWNPHERQRLANMQAFEREGVDPYAVLLAEARKRGIEALVTFRMNDAHGNDFLRTAFWRDHPECQLPKGALDFSREAVREHVFRLVEEAVQRYDCDGVELDFQRFPQFFPAINGPSPGERVAHLDGLVARVRRLLDEVGRQRGRRLVLAARPPSRFGQGTPTPVQSLEKGCDPGAWARNGWIDFLSVSEWLFTADTLGLGAWRQAVPGIPIYAGIQPEWRPSGSSSRCEACLGEAGYRKAARERWADGADGIYLFNFFTTREWPQPFEPPWEVLAELGSPATLAAIPVPPWETNAPIATVRSNLHRAHPRPRAAALGAMAYVGPALQRREWRGIESKDDVADEQAARWSDDNGRTWGDWIPQQPSSLVDHAGVQVWEGGWADTVCPVSGVLVQLWLHQIQRDGLFHNFSHARTSRDGGRTWSAPVALRYEDGPQFDVGQPAAPGFLGRNEGYPGSNIAALPDGTLVLALAHANAPGDPSNARRPWRMGSVLFRGQWNRSQQRHDWSPGARAEIRPDQSARGLMEPEVAVLGDGRMLVVWRGSDRAWDGTPAREPGRKWFAVSRDGGRTLSPVQAWHYSDGAPFYSASSLHRMIRHSNGRLYWIGNISPTPPRGNHPRHPLVMAEVDEATACLRRETVTVIADRAPWHGPDVQFSNFSLIEDRETRDMELHLTTFGQEPVASEWATADAWRFVVTLKEPDGRARPAPEP